MDYRGGASSRPGTKYILQAYKQTSAVRLIRFAASSTVQYVLEFGDYYMRPFINGSPVLETAVTVTAATSANPAVFTAAGHGYVDGDWVLASSFAGGTWGTEMNGRYFIVTGVSGADFSLTDLFGAFWSSVGFGTWSAGSFQRIYTIVSPYAAADLATLKFSQNVNFMELTHASYVPYILTLISAANWTITANSFGSSIAAPSAGLALVTTLAAGTVNYAYVVTSVDINGQESTQSAVQTLANRQDLRTTAGTNTLSWTAVPGAQSYNVYKAELSYAGAVPTGAAFGYVGNVTGVAFIDSNIPPDYSITPPVAKNPFQGASVASITVTAQGTYTSVPVVTVAAPSSGVQAVATALVGALSAVVAASGAPFAVNDVIVPTGGPGLYGGVLFIVTAINGANQATAVSVYYAGGISSGSTPANPVVCQRVAGGVQTVNLTVTWGVVSVSVVSGGAGYTSVPGVTFSAGAAAATAVLGAVSAGNPSVCAFWQQRLVLAGPTQSPQQLNFSIVGNYFNYNVHFPILPQDAIQYTIVSTELNQIKALLPMPTGLICFGDRMAWLLNGGAGNAPVEVDTIVANSQAYNGCSDVPPIVANQDILYVQAKGSIVRSLTYNFYTNIFTGVDITVLSSHLFYGYSIPEWTWAEEPFKLVWAVRSDGIALTCTYVKEQELIGWAHHTTDGSFKSVTSVTEAADVGKVDAVYFVVERTINAATVKYIERLAERYFPNGSDDAWCVDSGLQYDGAPATSFSGGEHLAGETIVGLADGVPITPFVMSANGRFTLPSASKVTLGLAFLPELQTLPLDIGEPTAQGKMKKIANVDLMIQDTLGLWIGSNNANSVPMKDLVLGNIGSMTNAVVTDLVTGQARTYIDPLWSVPGQYYIKQPNPLPASILGVLPSIVIGDTR